MIFCKGGTKVKREKGSKNEEEYYKNNVDESITEEEKRNDIIRFTQLEILDYLDENAQYDVFSE